MPPFRGAAHDEMDALDLPEATAEATPAEEVPPLAAEATVATAETAPAGALPAASPPHLTQSEYYAILRASSPRDVLSLLSHATSFSLSAHRRLCFAVSRASTDGLCLASECFPRGSASYQPPVRPSMAGSTAR